MAANTPPSGLPGFLRRSIRAPTALRDDSVGSDGMGPSAASSSAASGGVVVGGGSATLDAESAVAAAMAGGPTPPGSGQFRLPFPPTAATATHTQARGGAQMQAGTGTGTPVSGPTGPAGGGGGGASALGGGAMGQSESELTADSSADYYDEEEFLRREAEKEVESVASRVDRRFRFSLSISGRAKSVGAEGDGALGGGEGSDGDGENGALPPASPPTRRPGAMTQRSKSVPSSVGSGSGSDHNNSEGLLVGWRGDRDGDGGSDHLGRSERTARSAASDPDMLPLPPPPPSSSAARSPPLAAGTGKGTVAGKGKGGEGNVKGGKKLSYKHQTFLATISAPVVNVRDLRRLGWNGIPPSHRPSAWKILLGYLPANASRREQTLRRKRAEYRDAIRVHYDVDDNSRTSAEQETLRQVLVDVPRTAPDVGLFRNERVRQILGRLLYIWACRHPASSYVQGINDLATPLVVVFLSGYVTRRGEGDDDYGGGGGYGGEYSGGYGRDDRDDDEEDDHEEEEDEEDRIMDSVLSGDVMSSITDADLAEVEADVYWCLTSLLSSIQDHYTSDQPGVQRMVMRLEDLVSRIDAHLAHHLREVGVQFLQFAFRWMNCLLLREFNLGCIIRLWDTYLSEGEGGFEDFHVYVCAAFLCQFSGEVRGMEFDELFGFMQAIPTADWGDSEVEILLSQAFVLSTLFEGSDAHLTSATAMNQR